MAENKNNILLKYREDKVLYRVTKIRNGTVIEIDEMVEDVSLAHDLVDNLVVNTESQYGFVGQYSESPKNRILGDKAIVLIKFGNLGVEIGISVKAIVREFENLKNVYISTEADHVNIAPVAEPPKKKSFLEKVFSFAD